MSELTVPFDYRNILIGEEIIYRALLQQEEFAQASKYGASWTESDQLEKSAMYFKLNVMRSDFTIPAEFQHCDPYPPCPWPKNDAPIELSKIKPVIMGSDGVYTFAIGVFGVDIGSTMNVQSKIIDFNIDQQALAQSIRSEFTYYSLSPLSPVGGNSAFIVQKFHRGILERTFQYLFQLVL